MSDAPTDLGELARTKLLRVLGPTLSRVELARALNTAGLTAIVTVDDLAKVATALQGREGFVATVGALLSVEAAMRRLGPG